jgi:hypothetical protein
MKHKPAQHTQYNDSVRAWARKDRSSIISGCRNYFLYYHIGIFLEFRNLLFSEQRGSFPWVKAAGDEVDYSRRSSNEVKCELSYTSILSYLFIAWCLIGRFIVLQITLFCQID